MENPRQRFCLSAWNIMLCRQREFMTLSCLLTGHDVTCPGRLQTVVALGDLWPPLPTLQSPRLLSPTALSSPLLSAEAQVPLPGPAAL